MNGNQIADVDPEEEKLESQTEIKDRLTEILLLVMLHRVAKKNLESSTFLLSYLHNNE